ncbi:MAG: DUF1631 family protein [Halioglobus sp.]|nr:DUF1631 family protein [Halioglobus sp.]
MPAATGTDYLEIEPLKLKAEHFPLPCSLQKRVMARYAGTASFGAAELFMQADELLGYLRKVDYDKYSPLEGILAQTEAIGDPALPGREQGAILSWLGAALKDWENHLCIEEPLAGELRRLKPLLAISAVTDPGFLTPGAHPLHKLLDTIQQNAIGWQPRLGRLGETHQEQVRKAVDAALAGFGTRGQKLAAINTEMAANIARARERTSRMTQRLIEAEQGRIRVAQSKRQAALMINAALDAFPAPESIGRVLKGPWYDSAQLVLLKFGENSAEWESMSRTTSDLLASLQDPVDDEGNARRQQIFEQVSRLPEELRRWLLSLQHDGGAVDEVLELVEHLHARILRQQSLELQRIAPLALPGSEAGKRPRNHSLDQIHEGQWIIMDTTNSPALRAFLVMRMEEDQQLLFANQAGIKVLQHSFAEFARLMANRTVTLLDGDECFSRSLARSAGLETEDDLDELTGVAAEKARIREEQRRQAELEQARRARERAEQERMEQERLRQEQEQLEKQRREEEEAERLRREQEQAEQARRARLQKERQQLIKEKAQALQLQEQWVEISRRYREQADLERTRAGTGQAREAGQTDAMNLNLPMGTWLGFRDGDEATLARLAVYDRERDHYIFVDCEGKKIQQLGGRELLIRITRGVVDILEARSGFRDEVARIQTQANS